MKTNRLRIGMMLMLVASGAWAGPAGEPDPPQWRVQFENTGKYQTDYVPGPVRVQTAAGMLVFAPEELARIEFPLLNQCLVETVQGDRWFGVAQPKQLVRMVQHPELKDQWDAVRTIEFLDASTGPEEEMPMDWSVHFQNGSRIRMTLEEAPIRLQTEAGRLDVPVHSVRSLRILPVEGGVEGMLEIAPGGLAVHGRLSGRPLRGRDAGGRNLSIPWAVLSHIGPVVGSVPEASDLQRQQDVSWRMEDGSDAQGTTPVSIWRVRGRGFDRFLPSSRIRRIRRNSNKSFSVQTTVGEWLTGSVSPSRISLAIGPETVEMNLADSPEWTWSHAPEDMPEDAWSWRLTSGDILVAAWASDERASAPAVSAVPRVRGAAVQPDEDSPPAKVDGKWPVSRFEVIPWDGGPPATIPAALVEAVRALPPAQMPPAVPPSGPSAVWTDEVFVPGGSFQMGRTQGKGPADEVPPVELHLEPFWMASTPVTVAQFEAFAGATRHQTDAERAPGQPNWRSPGFVQRPDDPVVCVSWRDAVHYANWRSSLAGLPACYEFLSRGREIVFHPGRPGYRLPLEAEWEYAARSGGRDVVYPWGSESKEKVVAGLANFRLSSPGSNPWPWTSPVKAYPPSPAGLYDMAGNVWEWCQDVYREDAYLRLAHGGGMAMLLNAAAGVDVHRVMRGGSYHNPAEFLRCAARGFGMERMQASRVGFRLVRNAEVPGP